MKLIGNTWRKDDGLLIFMETGQAWDIGHWSDDDYAAFLDQDDQFCNVEMLVEKAAK